MPVFIKCLSAFLDMQNATGEYVMIGRVGNQIRQLSAQAQLQLIVQAQLQLSVQEPERSKKVFNYFSQFF